MVVPLALVCRRQTLMKAPVRVSVSVLYAVGHRFSTLHFVAIKFE